MRKIENAEERRKTKVIMSCLNGEIKAYQAAILLGIGVRQVENLKARVRKGRSIIHGNCGHKSGRAISKEREEKIVFEFKKLQYEGISFARFTKILNEGEYIASYSTVAKVLKKHGFISVVNLSIIS